MALKAEEVYAILKKQIQSGGGTPGPAGVGIQKIEKPERMALLIHTRLLIQTVLPQHTLSQMERTARRETRVIKATQERKAIQEPPITTT